MSPKSDSSRPRQLTSLDTMCNRVASDKHHELQMQLSHQVFLHTTCDSLSSTSVLEKAFNQPAIKPFCKQYAKSFLFRSYQQSELKTTAMGKASGRVVVALIVCFSVVIENVSCGVLADRVSRVFHDSFWLSITNYSAP